MMTKYLQMAQYFSGGYFMNEKWSSFIFDLLKIGINSNYLSYKSEKIFNTKMD